MRRRQVMADAPVLFRATLTLHGPNGYKHTWFDGPYPQKSTAKGRITFWVDYYAKTRGPGWSCEGKPEEASMTWGPSEV